MTRPSRVPVPTVRRGIAGELDAEGHFTAVDALLDIEPRQVIRGEIVRTDQLHVPPVGWVPVTDPTTPVFNAVNHDHRWERLLAASRADTAASHTHLLVTMAGAR